MYIESKSQLKLKYHHQKFQITNFKKRTFCELDLVRFSLLSDLFEWEISESKASINWFSDIVRLSFIEEEYVLGE